MKKQTKGKGIKMIEEIEQELTSKRQLRKAFENVTRLQFFTIVRDIMVINKSEGKQSVFSYNDLVDMIQRLCDAELELIRATNAKGGKV